MKRIIKVFLLFILCTVVVASVLAYSITQLDDKLSTNLRASLQYHLNDYIAGTSNRVANNASTRTDAAIMHLSALTGIAVTRYAYPEASTLLFHYIYGKGDDLELSSTYFQNSLFLKEKIQNIGSGNHGPLTIKQHEDWRLSLALNPFYLMISDEKVRLFHPKISFAAAREQSIYTIVPLGKLRIKVYDNIVSILHPTPFYVFSEWAVQ